MSGKVYILVEKGLLLKLAKQSLSSDEFRVMLALIALSSEEITIPEVEDGPSSD